jgi:hypothetical protein
MALNLVFDKIKRPGHDQPTPSVAANGRQERLFGKKAVGGPGRINGFETSRQRYKVEDDEPIVVDNDG